MKQKVKIKEDLIIKHKYELPINIENKSTLINTNSWFKIRHYKTNDVYNNFKLDNILIDNKLIKCLKINMKLNNHQREIMKIWMNSYTKMYNEALKYIKTKIPFFRTLNKTNVKNMDKKIIRFIDLRNNLKNIRDEIKETTKINKITIHTHTLDKSIKQLCSNI